MKQLSHVTHKNKAKKIEETGEFQVKKKPGKVERLNDLEEKSIGESFISNKEHTLFSYISPDETIFPGFYSWWGIHPMQSFKHPSGAIVANYLKDKPESLYGSCEFICNFQELLTAYATSRKCPTHSVCFRKGGTLRYKHEICYVIIISSSGEDDSALSNFEQLKPQSDQFNMDGLIGDDGKIYDDNIITAIPKFRPQYIVTYARGMNYSHETVAFAFYFPQESYTIKPRFSQGKIDHNYKYCIKKFPTESGGSWVCPDIYYSQTTDNVEFDTSFF